MKGNGAIKIEKGVPFVEDGRRKRAKYPWHEMKVGESFIFPDIASFGYEAARTATRRYAPKEFRARKVDGVMRCWRVA